MENDIGSYILQKLKQKKVHLMAGSAPIVVVGLVVMIVLCFLAMFVPKTANGDETYSMIDDALYSQYSQASVDYYNESGVYIPEEYFIASDMYVYNFVLPKNVNQNNIEVYEEHATITEGETNTLATPEEFSQNLYNNEQDMFDTYIDFEIVTEEQFVMALTETMRMYEKYMGQKVQVDGFVWPVNPHSITEGFGTYDKDDDGELDPHNGIDIPPTGVVTDVTASASGTVQQVSTGCTVGDNNCGGGFGNYVVLEHEIDGEMYTTMYAHLTDVMVEPGQKVDQGDVIGHMGSTGWVTGEHLHFEIHTGTNVFDHGGGEVSPSAIDPLPILKEPGESSGNNENEAGETPPAEGE